jgi:hypothetical protein
MMSVAHDYEVWKAMMQRLKRIHEQQAAYPAYSYSDPQNIIPLQQTAEHTLLYIERFRDAALRQP